MDEKHTPPKDYLLNTIAILMGGRAAEEIVLHTQTSGSGNDIERASTIARKMVCDYGMSDELGPLSFGKSDEQIFLGREIAQHRDYSEQTAEKIDMEVRNIVTGSYNRTCQLINDNIETLHSLANALLERETLTGSDIDEIMAGIEKNKNTPPGQEMVKGDSSQEN
jgi:cell division protease FtsH